jgi:hypothetical protein
MLSVPLPETDPVTLPYWESLRAHAMRLPWCPVCARAVFYPRPFCPRCGSWALEWRPASGRATLYSFTVVHRPPTREWPGPVPYVVALVDLEEGVRLMTTLVDVAPDPAGLRIGLPLEVTYDDVTPEITLPRYRPVAARDAAEAAR